MKPSNESQVNKIDESYIFNKCNELLDNIGLLNLPVKPEILASFCGIAKVSEGNIEPAGILLPTNDGIEIILRKQDSEVRKRFTCCHEIVHTFFPDYQLKPHRRDDKETGHYSKTDYAEYLCDFGASELLLPSFLFKEKFLIYGFNVESLKILSSEFMASLEATALKMVKMNPGKYAVVIWEETYKPTELREILTPTLPGFTSSLPKMKFRVKFAFGFDGVYHIPTHKSLDEDKNIIHESRKIGIGTIGIEKINFGKNSLLCKVFTLPLQSNKILTLLELV